MQFWRGNNPFRWATIFLNICLIDGEQLLVLEIERSKGSGVNPWLTLILNHPV
jgi:hypothetical protein